MQHSYTRDTHSSMPVPHLSIRVMEQSFAIYWHKISKVDKKKKLKSGQNKLEKSGLEKKNRQEI